MTGQRHLRDDQVVEMERQLAQHYGEPVMPVSRYCTAFRRWGDALAAKAKRQDDGTEYRDDASSPALRQIADARSALMLCISKSSMLGRLIYEGEELRTEMCPEHKGRWSGLEWVSDPHRCPHGCHLTGWLPASPKQRIQGGEPC